MSVSVVVMNIVVGFLLTSVVVIVAGALFVALALRRRRIRAEQIDVGRRLASTMSAAYWPHEGHIVAAMRRLAAMRSTTMIDDVTAFEVLVYKYRRRQRRRYEWPPGRSGTVEMTSIEVAVPDSSTTGVNNGDYEEQDVRLSSSATSAAINSSLNALCQHQKPANLYDLLDCIDQLFDLLLMTLVPPPYDYDTNTSVKSSRSPRCPRLIASSQLARTVCGLALSTAAVWDDWRASGVRRLLAYFDDNDGVTSSTLSSPMRRQWRRILETVVRRRRSLTGTGNGPTALDTFDSARSMTDLELTARVRTRLPYVDRLRLVGHGGRFVLSDVNMSTDDHRGLRAAVRRVDEALSRAFPDAVGARLTAVERWGATLIGAYRDAINLAVVGTLITGRQAVAQYPEFSPISPPPISGDEAERPSLTSVTVRSSEAVATVSGSGGSAAGSSSMAVNSPETVIIALRHLVRLMCGSDETFRRFETDQRFAALLTTLNDVLTPRGSLSTGAVDRSVVRRCRANVLAYTRAMVTANFAGTSSGHRDSTRRVLEQAGEELYGLIDTLTRRRLESMAQRRHCHQQYTDLFRDENADADLEEDDFHSAVVEFSTSSAVASTSSRHHQVQQLQRYTPDPLMSAVISSSRRSSSSRLTSPTAVYHTHRSPAASGIASRLTAADQISIVTANSGGELSTAPSSAYASPLLSSSASSLTAGNGNNGWSRALLPTVAGPTTLVLPGRTTSERLQIRDVESAAGYLMRVGSSDDDSLLDSPA